MLKGGSKCCVSMLRKQKSNRCLQNKQLLMSVKSLEGNFNLRFKKRLNESKRSSQSEALN